MDLFNNSTGNGIKNIKNPIVKIVVLAVVVFFGCGFYNIFLNKIIEERNNIENALKKYSMEGSNECPIPIGDNMIMENVSYLEKKTIRYDYQLINGRKDEFDLPILKKNLNPYRNFAKSL
jgi:hypothetical protein